MKFRTGALCWSEELKEKSPLKGKFFEYSFEKHHYRHSSPTNWELIITAIDEERAQRSYELFIASLTLISGHTIYSIGDLPSVISYGMDFINPPEDFYYINAKQYSTSGIFTAAQLATKASFRKKHSISLLKYLFACSQHSNYLIHLDPFHSGYEKLSRNPLDHLRYSYAILTLYSIIEEIGIEIRASQKNPSKIDGEWNPIIKKDLEKRIKNSKIDINKKAHWNLRSRPTKIQPKDKLNITGKASWARYSIRDSTIEIIDAISYLSWLRSKILAHKLSDKYTSISIYDVANVNFLIRQFLMDILKEKRG